MADPPVETNAVGDGADRADEEPRLDPTTLPGQAQKILDPKSPGPLRAMAAKGIAPGLKPHEALAVVVLLAESEDETVRATALATLEKLPAPLLAGALTPSLSPAVVHVVALRYARDAAVMEKLIVLPQIVPLSVAMAAALASEQVSELIATNEERLLANPRIIENLYMNRATRMSTADRILELAVRNKVELPGIPAYAEAAAAIMNELIPEPQEEPTFDDILFREADALAAAISDDPAKEDTHKLDEETGEEKVEDKFMPLHLKLAEMTVSQKIRRAMLGSSAERSILIRDRNRLVASAAIKSPLIQENEVARIAASRNVNEDVLREIANNREWTSTHQIKLNLVMNPRTPFVFASKLISHLREHELKSLAKNKNVPGAVATAARQQLLRKQK
jgi:hypothetical protein